MIGHDWRVESIVDPSAQPGTEPQHTVTRAATPEAPAASGAPAAAASPRAEPGAGQGGAAAPAPPEEPKRPLDPETIARARGAIQDTRSAGDPRQHRRSDVSDEDADRDDPDADDHSIGGAQLLERELGASIIEEIKHD